MEVKWRWKHDLPSSNPLLPLLAAWASPSQRWRRIFFFISGRDLTRYYRRNSIAEARFHGNTCITNKHNFQELRLLKLWPLQQSSTSVYVARKCQTYESLPRHLVTSLLQPFARETERESGESKHHHRSLSRVEKGWRGEGVAPKKWEDFRDHFAPTLGGGGGWVFPV